MRASGTNSGAYDTRVSRSTDGCGLPGNTASRRGGGLVEAASKRATRSIGKLGKRSQLALGSLPPGSRPVR